MPNCQAKCIKSSWNVQHPELLQNSFGNCCLRPKAKDLGITQVAVGFFIWSMPYQLQPLCLPQFILYFYLSIYLSIHLSNNQSSSIFFCQSINWPLPFPKYQYIIAADPGAGIGLVNIGKHFTIETSLKNTLTKTGALSKSSFSMAAWCKSSWTSLIGGSVNFAFSCSASSCSIFLCSSRTCSNRTTFLILPSRSPIWAEVAEAADSGRAEIVAAIWASGSRVSGRYRVRERSSNEGGTWKNDPSRTSETF